MIALLLAGAGSIGFRAEALRFSPSPTSLVLRDVTGDGLADLITSDGTRLSILPQSDAGFAGGTAVVLPPPSSPATLFDVADLDGDRKAEVVLLEGGKKVLAIPIGADARPGEPSVLLGEVRAHAPLGLRRARLVRDIDGDGDGDLTLPGPAETLLFTRANGRYVPAGSLPADVDLTLHVGDSRLVTARDLKEKFESAWSVPLFELSDLNGDGRADLVAETDDSVSFTLVGADGSIPEKPTFRLDLERLRKGLPKNGKPGNLDPENLASIVSNRVEWIRRDIDGDDRADFLVRAGDVITVYRGGASGVDFAARPSQVLKASGNLLGIALDDDDGNGRPDLLVARVEDISIPQALSWLLLPIRVSVDVFVYHAREGASFSSRPDRRQRFTVSLPSARTLVLEPQRLREQATGDLLAGRGDFDGDGEKDDLFLVRPEGVLEVYAGAAAGTTIGVPRTLLAALKELGWGSKQEEVVVTLERISDLAGQVGTRVKKAIEGKKPDWSLRPPEALPDEAEEALSLWVFDLDGDKRDDAVVGWLTPEGVRDRPFVGTVLFSSRGSPGAEGR
ncbi:MAG: VCBS repeat-containing protein [Planctomycetes bacterium]|nr:VCBS repeat-containing protein [Planctomycetota bacterium]